MASPAAKDGACSEGYAPITIGSMAEERQAVVAKVAEVEALKQQLEEQTQKLITAAGISCRRGWSWCGRRTWTR